MVFLFGVVGGFAKLSGSYPISDEKKEQTTK